MSKKSKTKNYTWHDGHRESMEEWCKKHEYDMPYTLEQSIDLLGDIVRSYSAYTIRSIDYVIGGEGPGSILRVGYGRKSDMGRTQEDLTNWKYQVRVYEDSQLIWCFWRAIKDIKEILGKEYEE